MFLKLAFLIISAYNIQTNAKLTTEKYISGKFLNKNINVSSLSFLTNIYLHLLLLYLKRCKRFKIVFIRTHKPKKVIVKLFLSNLVLYFINYYCT